MLIKRSMTVLTVVGRNHALVAAVGEGLIDSFGVLAIFRKRAETSSSIEMHLIFVSLLHKKE